MQQLLFVGLFALLSSSQADVKHVLDGSARPPPCYENHQHYHESSSGNFASQTINGEKASESNAVTGSVPFWWAETNSPFKQTYEYFKKCSSKTDCIPPVAPSFQPPQYQPPTKTVNDIEIGQENIAKNPFLNGQIQGVSQTTPKIDLSGNPFINSGMQAAYSSTGQAVTTGSEGFLGVQPSVPFSSNFASSKQVCASPSHVCVAASLCVDGVVNQKATGVSNRQCEIGKEVCCRLSEAAYSSHGTTSSSFASFSQSSYSNLSHIASGKASLDSTIKFGGGAGLSPGSIQIISDSESIPNPLIPPTTKGGVKNPSNTIKVIRNTYNNNAKPVFASTIDYTNDKLDDLSFDSAFQGPQYLPPLDSTKPPVFFTNDLNPPIYTYQPTSFGVGGPHVSPSGSSHRPTASNEYLPPYTTPKPAPSPPNTVHIPTGTNVNTQYVIPPDANTPPHVIYQPTTTKPFVPSVPPSPTPGYQYPQPSPTFGYPHPSTVKPIVSQGSNVNNQYASTSGTASTSGYSYPQPTPPFVYPQPSQSTYQPYVPPQPSPSTYKPYVPPQPSPSTYKPYVPPQPSPSTYKPYVPPQPSPSTYKPYVPPQPSPSTYKPYVPPQPSPSTYKPYVPPQPSPSTYKPYVPPQPFPSTYKPYVPPQPSPSTYKPYVPPQPFPSTYKPYVPPQSSQSTYNPSFTSSQSYDINNNYITPKQPVKNGYSYPTPHPTFTFPPYQPQSSNIGEIYQTAKPKPTSNQYLPPTKTSTEPNLDVGASGDVNFVRPPPYETGSPNEPIGNVAFPHGGCAAALKCVQEIYCTADGMISPTPVVLTKEQDLQRVPTTDCFDRQAGVIGKCCRDPFYVDPWPSANNLNGFDDGQYKEDPRLGQYFPQKQRPARSGSIKSAPKPEKCGVRNPSISPRAQGPLEVNFAEIPWQAMVLRDTNRSLLCGGVIVKPNAVLTAAHCVEGLETSDVLVKGGEWKLGIDEEPLPFQIVKVAAIIPHPDYTTGSLKHDLALLMLEERLRPASNIGPICLPQPNQKPQQQCITTGWGKRILQVHLRGAIMRSVDVNLLESSQCTQQLQKKYQGVLPDFAESVFCGFSKHDQCDVDYGSALACTNGDGQYTLAGIFSWDTGCKDQEQIGGYIPPDMDWIETTCAKPLKELKALDKQYH